MVVMATREWIDPFNEKSETLVEFMQATPFYGLDEVVFERDSSPGRELCESCETEQGIGN